MSVFKLSLATYPAGHTFNFQTATSGIHIFDADWVPRNLVSRLTFHSNGGFLPGDNPTRTQVVLGRAGQALGEPRMPMAPTGVNRIFRGWSTSQGTGSGHGLMFDHNTPVPNRDMEYWAVWEVIHPLRALTTAEVNALMSHPRYVNEWELPVGYAALSGSVVSYSAAFASNPVRDVTIFDRNVRLYRWLFLQEPGMNGKVIGVPVIENMSNNGGLDTGLPENIVTILGGASQERTISFASPIPNTSGNFVNVTNIRTVLMNSFRDALVEISSAVPEYRIHVANSRSRRVPPDNPRSQNHPNAVAVDINYHTPPGLNWSDHPRRLERGVNAESGLSYLNSLDVEDVMRQHGWRMGYIGDNSGPISRGFMHWSISRT